MKESVNVRLLLMEFLETCAKFKHFIFITEWWLLKIIVLLVLGDLAYSAAPRLLLWEKQQYLLLSRYGTRHLAQTFLLRVFVSSGTQGPTSSSWSHQLQPTAQGWSSQEKSPICPSSSYPLQKLFSGSEQLCFHQKFLEGRIWNDGNRAASSSRQEIKQQACG